MAEYIERYALMKNFCGYDLTKCFKYGNKSAEQQHDSYSTMMMYEIADVIEDAPAADVVPVRHGRWMNANSRPKTYERRCTACGGRAYFCGLGCSYKYCPNCGAKMDGGAE